MQAEVMKITPLMAKEALSRNTVNRRISDSRVSMYADDMRRGEWQLNGEAIVFAEDGTLINGQHRLAAIVRSGCTVQMLVVKGVKDDVSLFDRGRNRSQSDAISMEGVLASSYTVAMARLWIYMNEKSECIVSDSRLKRFHQDHEEAIRTVVNMCRYANRKGHIQPKNSYFMTALFSAYEFGVPKEVLERFTNIVVTGIYKDESEQAAIAIRNDIMYGNTSTRTMSAKKDSCLMVQGAIMDFYAGKHRKRSYKNAKVGFYGKKELKTWREAFEK